MKTPHKRAKKQGGSLGGSEYSTGARRTIAKATGAGTNKASTGATKTVAGNPRTGMGVKKGSSQGLTDKASASGPASGRARTRRGKNSTTAGPQGMRG